MDISDTLAPASDQLDAIDLAATGPRIFKIESVSKGSAEQPVNIHLADFPRPWRPGKTMRRVLAYCWGVETSEWVGRDVELFCDPEVTFGKNNKVGGTRISRLSHIDGSKEAPVLLSQGRPGRYKVEPLPADAVPSAPPAKSDTAKRAKEGIDYFYATHNITQDQLEERVGKPASEWTDADIEGLKAYSVELQAANDAPPGGSE